MYDIWFVLRWQTDKKSTNIKQYLSKIEHVTEIYFTIKYITHASPRGLRRGLGQHATAPRTAYTVPSLHRHEILCKHNANGPCGHHHDSQ